MKFIERRTPRVLAASAAIGIGCIGVSACSNPETDSKPAPTTTTTVVDCAASSLLEGVRLIGAGKDGNYNVVNADDCVAVYSPQTLQTIGTIAQNETFEIVCYDGPKPEAFRVQISGGTQGDVNMGAKVVEQLNAGEFSAIPACTAAVANPQAV